MSTECHAGPRSAVEAWYAPVLITGLRRDIDFRTFLDRRGRTGIPVDGEPVDALRLVNLLFLYDYI